MIDLWKTDCIQIAAASRKQYFLPTASTSATPSLPPTAGRVGLIP
jgi:hypothetical protein